MSCPTRWRSRDLCAPRCRCRLQLWRRRPLRQLPEQQRPLSLRPAASAARTAGRASGKFAADADWLRSEFVRQVLKKPEVADNMPHSGPRNWSSRENWLKPVPLHDHIVKYGEPAKMICPYTGVDRLA